MKLIFFTESEAESKAVITKNQQELKGFVRSYNVKIVNSKDPKMQFNGVRNTTAELLKKNESIQIHTDISGNF